ncbi:hypothetical protein NS376_16190 [Pseudomonas oryzihabitans]|nr:hypothetical protein NS376_16190 [Pseudomonas psychrotolerans]
MQLSIEQGRTQIHIAGQGMIRLSRAGRCVGFAETYRKAELRADQLDRYFDLKEALSKLSVDTTTGATFGSAMDEPGAESVGEVTGHGWLVETVSGMEIQRFPSLVEAQFFAEGLLAYNQGRPVPAEDGCWTEAELSWWENHPARVAAGYLEFRVRSVTAEGVH